MPLVEVEGVGLIELSDEWDEQQIRDFVKKKFGDGGDDGEVADPETSWFFERFGEAFGKSYAAAEEGLAIGQLVVANDKKFALDLLEGEFNQWQNNAEEGEEPPPFFSWASAGEIGGGVIRDIGVGVGVGALATPATTPIGGIIAGAAATTSLQSLTAKGASFKDSYIQIRAKQLERGVDDKEAAYETARKISNADAAYAAAETVVSTAAPGFGKVGTRAITKGVGKVGGRVMSRAAVDVTGKAISELGVDAVAGGVGSIASDLTAEALGGEQGIDRGNIWENAAKAATAEALVGLPTSLIRTKARHKEFTEQEKFLDDALDVGRQYQSDQQEIEAQTDIIVKRGQEHEREQARRLREGEVPPADRAKRETQNTPIIIDGKPIGVADRLVLPPDVRNVPPPGMGIPVDESFMATGEGVSPILDERGNIMLPSTHPLGGDPRGTEARAMQAQGARASAAFSRIGHAKLGDAMTWLDNRIGQLESLRERGVKFPKKEFPIEEGQLELQFGWPTDGPALDALGFDENISRVLNPNFDLSTPAPGLNIDSELERLSHLRGLFDGRQSELEFKEKEAEVVGVKVTDHREPSHILFAKDDPRLYPPPKPVTLFHSGFHKSSKEEFGKVRGDAAGVALYHVDEGKVKSIAPQQRRLAREHIERGWKLFLDTGAYPIFKHNTSEKGQASGQTLEVPFDKPSVLYKPGAKKEGKIKEYNPFDLIDEILYDLDETQKSRVTVVMPDVIGDQQGTLDLQSKHIDRIKGYIDTGVEVIIPMHKTNPNTKKSKGRGEDSSLESVYDGLTAELDPQREGKFRVGVPSNAEAINPKEFTDFIRNRKPKKIHLLGTGYDLALGADSKIGATRLHSPETDITIDTSTVARKAFLRKATPKDQERTDNLLGKAREKVGTDTLQAGVMEEYIDIMDYEIPGFVKSLGLDADHKALLQDRMSEMEGSYTFGEFLEDVTRMEGGDIYDEPSGRAGDYLTKAVGEWHTPRVSKERSAYGMRMLERERERIESGGFSPYAQEKIGISESGEFTQVEKEARAFGVAEGKVEAEVEIEAERKAYEKAQQDKQKAKELLNAVIATGRQIGKSGMTSTSMGVNPAPVWEHFKALTSLARYHIARGVKSAAEFAKKAGLKLTAFVKKSFEVAKSKRAIQPKDMGARVTAAYYGSDRTMTAEGQAKQAIRDRIQDIVYPGKRVELHLLKKDRTISGVAAHRVFADRFIGLKNLQDFYEKGKEIPDTNNAYQAEQLMHGILGAKLADFETEVTSIMTQIRDFGLDNQDVEAFLYARHAEERNNHIATINKKFPDGGSGMTNADAVAIMEQITDSGKIEAYQKIAALIDSINQRTLQVQFKGGLINEQEYNALSNFYEAYVPLKGHQDSDPLSHRTGNHVSINSDIRGEDNPYALGHGEQSKDILAHVFEQHANAIARSERNAVYQTLLNWTQSNPDNDVIEVATTENAPMEQRRTKAKMEKVDGVDYIVEEATTKDVKQSGWPNNPDVIALRVNGENVYLRVKEKSLAKNLKEMGTSSLPGWAGYFAGFQRWRAMTNTMLNVDFPLSNFIRDITTAGINLGAEETAMMQKAALKNVKPALKAIWKGERGKISDPEMAKLYKLFRENGGKMEFTSMQSLEANVKKIDGYSRRYTGLRGKTRKMAESKAVQGAFKLLENANTAMENATRLAVFKAALDSGKATPKQAAFLARNITVNFTKKGELGTELNTVYLFYNASVQGSLRIVQAAKSPRVQKILMGIMGLGAAENLINQMVGEEDEDGRTDYDKIPEYIKQSNMVIPTPDFLGLKRKFITIPLPYGYNAFYYAGKQVTSVIPALGGKKTIGDATGHTLDATLNAFNPIGGSGNIFRSLTPEVIKPIVDIGYNEDWKGDRIRPDRNPFEKYEIPDSELKWATASTPAVTAARKLNALFGGSREKSAGLADISPETLDYAVQFITGGMGQSISRAIDLPFKAAKGKARIEDIPIVRRFQEDPSPYYEIQNYKVLRNDAHAYEAGLTRMRKEKVGVRKIEAYKKENSVLRRMLGRVKSTDASLKIINKSIKTTEASASLNRAVKNKRLETLNDRKQKLLRRTSKRYYDLANEE